MEDPNEFFQNLREFCDACVIYKMFQENQKLAISQLPALCKLTKKHVERVLEILNYCENSKSYRFGVKKRIFREYIEVTICVDYF